ncbi:CTP synthase [Cladophialophora carrionii CBS 160.54]|uniref:CTP synthase n=1 Tax=Cladophialophora carrionii CBS 160.54 TaxID=1279043 RepID=V9D0F0_9EURO|nr:CTP synthase [Cladophialophora carrionii CBS 160.54]ETI20379.1 CTP synthase [Cladophialophora carrionii CBS 160.54]
MKYVLVSGGVISGIGKGIIASSTGLLLKTVGLKVTAIKIDPYLNVDAGTMAPTEHGECFVLDDGGEVDLDLGNYERYLNVTLTLENSITTGKMYQHVIERERRGDYLGKTVQVVPHITNAIQDWIERVARIPVDDTKEEPDVCIIELGGTVGDIESAPFIEAMRQLRRRAGRDNFVHIHVSLVPVISGEQKTKPTQQAIRDARAAGLAPDLIGCRCQQPLEDATINKIAMFCQVEPMQVLAVHDVESTYHVPLLLEQQKLPDQLRDLFRLDAYPIAPTLVTRGHQLWSDWKKLTTSQERFLETEKVTIALVGKYTNLHDSYLSVIKALEHSAMACQRKLNLIWVDAGNLEKATLESNPETYHKAWHELCTADGVLVPGGFGHRGTEGMVAAANWARTKPKPYLGICLGMQVAVIEYARNVCGLKGAHSVELDARTTDPVVVFMPEIDKATMGGNMRLGLRPTLFQEKTSWSRLRKLYGNAPAVNERHRHRYEVNPEYITRLSDAGLTFIGKDDKGERMEVIELEDHPWFVGVQFHPEYLSRVLRPSPPYLGFVAASAGVLEKVTAQSAAMQEQVNGDAAGEVHGGVNGVNGLTNGVKPASHGF